MQLVITVDLDKSKQSLPEIFRLIGSCCGADEAAEEITAGLGAPITDDQPRVIGEWSIEEEEETPKQRGVEASYRAAAAARYAQPGQIEVDRFATVSPVDDGAFVQGWLYVPRAEIASGAQEPAVVRKPPQSISPIESSRKIG